jgi:hypothetical protein
MGGDRRDTQEADADEPGDGPDELVGSEEGGGPNDCEYAIPDGVSAPRSSGRSMEVEVGPWFHGIGEFEDAMTLGDRDR